MRLLRSIGCLAAAAMLCAISMAPASAEMIPIDPGIYAVSVAKEYPAPVADVIDHVAIVAEADITVDAPAAVRSTGSYETASVAAVPFAPSAYQHIDPDIAAD